MNIVRLRYKKWYNILKDGISKNNPIVIAVLGICSALAVTNRVDNAIAMGLGVTFVIMGSSSVISSIRRFVPSKLRMVTYMVVISTFVIIVQAFLQAYLPAFASRLGAYVGLIITNCIVMGRAEAFAVKNPVKYSIVDGFAAGMGYTFVLVSISIIRELLAFGSILNIPILPENFPRWVVMTMAPGGFFVLGLFIWVFRELAKYYEEEKGEIA